MLQTKNKQKGQNEVALKSFATLGVGDPACEEAELSVSR